MFPEFACTYRDKDGKVHLYVFPGIGADGKQIYKNMDLNNINVPYTYVKHDDKAYDFTFATEVHNITCSMKHAATGKTKMFSFRNV